MRDAAYMVAIQRVLHTAKTIAATALVTSLYGEERRSRALGARTIRTRFTAEPGRGSTASTGRRGSRG